MTEWPEVQLCVILPCGTVTLPFADGTITCRSAVGHLHTPETGLLAEMRRAKHGPCEPVPWRSAAVRDAAMAEVERHGDLDDATRAALLEWIAATPYYED